MRCALVRLGHFRVPVKFGGTAPPRGRNMAFRKISLWWVNISRVISDVSGLKFTQFFLFNAELTVFDNAV